MWLLWITLAFFSFLHWEACVQRFYRLYTKIEQSEQGNIIFKKESPLLPQSHWIKVLFIIELGVILYISYLSYKAGYSFLYPFLFGLFFVSGVQFPLIIYTHQDYVIITNRHLYRIAPGMPQLSIQQWRSREYCPPGLVLYMIKPYFKKVAHFQIEWDEEKTAAHYCDDEGDQNQIVFNQKDWDHFYPQIDAK